MSDSLILFALLALLLITAIYFITIYNRLQSLKNGAEATLSQIRVAMKKRLDMIEQLVDSVKSYAKFERDTLEKITSMRTNLVSARPDELAKINGVSRGLVGDVLAVAEGYPQLKTSEAVTATMNAIKDVEDEISRYRYTYNNIIQEFNTMRVTVPSNMVASFSGMHKMDYLNFEEDELKRRGYLTTEGELEPGRPEVKWD
ncbi:MAG: LemA family protein [Methanosaeta sp. PtaU1.Bin060]|nr:MAG: LemA family protein [Methanosaeta sp. PtaU1.Bin060]